MNFKTSLNRVLEEIEIVLSDLTDDSIDTLTGEILTAKRVFIFGVGRSGLIMKAFAMRLMHLNLKVHVVGEVTAPSIIGNDLLIVGTASGETAFTVSACRKAVQIGAKVVAITAGDKSTVASLSGKILLIPTTTPKVPTRNGFKSIQPMGNLFEQALLLVTDLIVLNLMERLDLSSKEMFDNHANLE